MRGGRGGRGRDRPFNSYGTGSFADDDYHSPYSAETTQDRY